MEGAGRSDGGEVGGGAEEAHIRRWRVGDLGGGERRVGELKVQWELERLREIS